MKEKKHMEQIKIAKDGKFLTNRINDDIKF